MEIRIDEAILWNLGYCPSYSWFDELLEQRNALSNIVKESDPEWWVLYEMHAMAETPKKLMVFL